MLPRYTYSGLACALALLPAISLAQGADVIPPEAQHAVRAAKTIQVEVQQTYDLADEKAEETDEGEDQEGAKKTNEETAKEKKPEEKFSLPLAELTEQAVKLAGWSVVKPGEPAQLVLTIDVQGTPRGASYTGSLGGYRYTGAELAGTVQLALGGEVMATEEIMATVPIEPTIRSQSFNYRSSPRDAPFEETLPKFCEAVFTLLGRVRGPALVVAGLKLESSDHRAGAARALLTTGDESVGPALIEILRQENNPVAASAALGLGVHGRAAAVAPLLAALGRDQTHADLAGLRDFSEHELVRSLIDSPPEPDAPADRAAAARDLLDARVSRHQAVEWALVQIESADKFSQLVAALKDGQGVMLRRGAAVVLGGLGDRQAFAFLTAAARDPEPLVRGAALAALGRLDEDRSIDIALAMADDSAGYVSRLARDQLADAGRKRWEAFIRSRGKTFNALEIPATALLGSFAHADPLVRAEAARLSAHRPELEIQAALAGLLRSDPQAFVREAAVEALAEARVDGDDNDPSLAQALGDADPATRRRAIEALTSRNGDDNEDEDEDEAEGKTKPSPLPATVLEPVLTLLARDELNESDALQLLTRIEDPGAAELLVQALREVRPQAVQRVAGMRLAALNDKRAVPVFLAVLAKATEVYPGQYAADALVTLGDPAVMEPLFLQLKSGTPAARLLALSVLGRLREPRAIGPLIAALRAAEAASHGEMVHATHQALARLTGKNFSTGEQWMVWWKENAGKPIVLPPVESPAAETPPDGARASKGNH